jgi:ABC-type taurine transport system ATPase subunit
VSPKSKKYLITTKSREVYILRGGQKQTVRGYCATCATEVEMLTLDATTTKTGKSTRELIQLIENNLIHSFETESGHLLICLNLLPEIYSKN